MSSDRNYWEAKFVDVFILEAKRSRYKKLLRNPRKRSKILDRLNHCADLDFSQGVRLTGKEAFSAQLIEKLLAYNIDEECWLISDDTDLDCKLLPMREAAALTAEANWGTIMICPPKPIVVYRAEASDQSLYLLS